VNAVLATLPELLGDLDVVMGDVARPRTRLDRVVPALDRTMRQLAPVSRTLADLVVNSDTTFTALAAVAPQLEDAIGATPPALAAGIDGFAAQRAFLTNATTLVRRLQPGVDHLRRAAPTLTRALEAGTPRLIEMPAVSRRLDGLFRSLESFSGNPLVPLALNELDRSLASLRPTLHELTPAQTTCNYVTLWFRNVSSVLSDGGRSGTWQRFLIIPTPEGPNNEGGPATGPANGPGEANHLHANPYPNTAAPGQPRECEAGNEPYAVGETTIGNLRGNQGTVTEGQEGARR
jgi:ABC-type transporter Mla subunit MlaD